MKQYNVCVEVVRCFTCKANSKEEAFKKYVSNEGGSVDISEPIDKPIIYNENWEEADE